MAGRDGSESKSQGLRAFLVEIAVVVIGVVVALGAEQTVSAWREQAKAREAEGLIRDELATGLAYARERIAVTPCIRRRLAEIRGLLVSSRAGALADLSDLGHAPMRPFTADQWSAAVSGGVTPLFPAQRRVAYEGSAGRLTRLASEEVEEQKAWAALGALEHDPLPLDSAAREHLLEAVQEARLESDLLDTLSRQVIQSAAQARVKAAAPARDPALEALCRPLKP